MKTTFRITDYRKEMVAYNNNGETYINLEDGKIWVSPWHTGLCIINLTLRDEENGRTVKSKLWLNIADWISKKELRETVSEIIYKNIYMPGNLLDDEYKKYKASISEFRNKIIAEYKKTREEFWNE